jgi:hypothetical protein
LYPSLALHAQVLLASGHRAEAIRLADELLALINANRTGFMSYWAIPLAIVLTELDRVRDLEAAIESRRVTTRWMEAARAYGQGAHAESADILEDMGALAVAAYARMKGAESLVREGRRAEADAQLQQALAFYRSVGATAYIREAEGLFAASA